MEENQCVRPPPLAPPATRPLSDQAQLLYQTKPRARWCCQGMQDHKLIKDSSWIELSRDIQRQTVTSSQVTEWLKDCVWPIKSQHHHLVPPVQGQWVRWVYHGKIKSFKTVQYLWYPTGYPTEENSSSKKDHRFCHCTEHSRRKTLQSSFQSETTAEQMITNTLHDCVSFNSRKHILKIAYIYPSI